MSTPTSGDLLLVNRGGVNYQIDYDDMSTLQDTDLLLVNRAGVNYQIAASDLDLGPDGLILPSVDVLTPVNGAGLNEGASYTPLSSAYVSTDTTPIYNRYFPQTITTISGGTWTDENNAFDGNTETFAVLGETAGAVSQFVFTNIASLSKEGESTVYAYSSSGGSIEVIDENDAVLRTYALPTSAGSTSIGIVRPDNKIRFTSASNNYSIYLSRIDIDGGPVAIDSIITGRVALQFTDDTDLDKMVAPIIMTDENGNVKVPTTSTVDSTTTIPGLNKDMSAKWSSNGSNVTYDQTFGDSERPPIGPRMSWIRENAPKSTLIADNVAIPGKYLYADVANGATSYWAPELNENESVYRANSGQYNNSGKANYVHEIGVAPGVLDIISFEGDGTNFREIPHNLGTRPGMVILKKTDDSDSWSIWHKDLKPSNILSFESQNGEHNPYNAFPSNPTADSIFVGNNGAVNGAGHDFVAYVFAADSPGKVKCGKYEGNGATNYVDLGFQPAFTLIKRVDGSTDWVAATEKSGEAHAYWYLNRQDVAMYGNSGDYIGFQGWTQLALNGGNTDFNANNSDYIYIAVASSLTGPNSTQLNLLSGQDLEYFTTGTAITSNAAASGSNVSFGSMTWSGTSVSPGFNLLPSAGGEYFMDIRESANNKWLVWIKSHNTSNGHNMYDSERSYRTMLSSVHVNPAGYTGDNNTIFQGPATGNTPGYSLGRSGYTNETGSSYISWNFKAAPQFFDVQKYIGQEGISSTNKLTINHDLGVEPGCIIIKSLNDHTDWQVWHHELSSTNALRLNVTNGQFDVGLTWLEADASSFSFNNSSSNYSSGQRDYISYIFAKDTPYVKCGKYTGAGPGTVVDFGFTPRWVMVKSLNNGSHVIFDERLSNKILYTAMDNEAQGFNFSMDSNGLTMNGNFGSTNYAGYEYTYVAIAAESEGHPPFPPSSTTVTETPDPATATMVVNAESFDVGATASGPALTASITSLAGVEGNSLIADNPTGTWMPGLYAKGSETTVSAPSADEITFTSTNAGSTAFSGVDATLTSRTWTLESGPSATGPWTLVDTYVDYDALASQDGATPWSSNKPALAADTFYRVKVSYDSTNAESVESVYSTFKTSA